MHPGSKSRTRERLAVYELFRNSELKTGLTDLVFEEVAERLNDLFEINIIRKASDIVVGFDHCRFSAETTLYNVRINRSLYKEADAIYREEIAKAGIDRNIGQYFAALTNMRSVGVMGDERTYDYAIALRAVNTIDFMTAEAAEIPWEVLGIVSSRIVNEVPHVNRVLYDCTGKPPATIEFE